MRGPKEQPIADFSNTISAQEGVFLANGNDRGARTPENLPPDGRDPIEWQFSTVAWWMWKKTVLKDNPKWEEKPNEADFSGIKSFWRRMIKNADTQEILTEAFQGVEPAVITKTWTPEDPDPDKNPFWALLGSPNGNGIQYFLRDNKNALRGKGIKSIKAGLIGGEWNMWAIFTDGD